MWFKTLSWVAVLQEQPLHAQVSSLQDGQPMKQD